MNTTKETKLHDQFEIRVVERIEKKYAQDIVVREVYCLDTLVFKDERRLKVAKQNQDFLDGFIHQFDVFSMGGWKDQRGHCCNCCNDSCNRLNTFGKIRLQFSKLKVKFFKIFSK